QHKTFLLVLVRSKRCAETWENTRISALFRLPWDILVSAPSSQQRIAHLERELAWAQLKIQVLEQRLRQQRIRMLGPQSETLSDLQLELLAEEEPGVTAAEIDAEARREVMNQMPRRQ